MYTAQHFIVQKLFYCNQTVTVLEWSGINALMFSMFIYLSNNHQSSIECIEALKCQSVIVRWITCVPAGRQGRGVCSPLDLAFNVFFPFLFLLMMTCRMIMKSKNMMMMILPVSTLASAPKSARTMAAQNIIIHWCILFNEACFWPLDWWKDEKICQHGENIFKNKKVAFERCNKSN